MPECYECKNYDFEENYCNHLMGRIREHTVGCENYQCGETNCERSSCHGCGNNYWEFRNEVEPEERDETFFGIVIINASPEVREIIRKCMDKENKPQI